MLLIRHLVGEPTDVLVLGPRFTLIEAARFLRDHKIGGAPVVDGAHLVGFCSEQDLVFRCMAEGRDPKAMTVADVMSRRVVTAHLDDSVEECEERLRQTRCRHMPVMDGGRLVACLSLRDFLRTELRACHLEVEQLKGYIQGAG